MTVELTVRKSDGNPGRLRFEKQSNGDVQLTIDDAFGFERTIIIITQASFRTITEDMLK